MTDLDSLAERRSKLSSAKRAMLDKLRQGQATAAMLIVPVPSRSEPFPLSFAQERHWFLHQLLPDASLDNLSFMVRLVGPLDVAVLERCLQALVQRHESLRTIFPLRDDQPVQQVLRW